MGFIASTQNGFQLLAIKQIQEMDLSNYRSIKRANIIVKVQNKVVLHFNQYQNHWELVTGNLKSKESPLDAIKRGWEKKTSTSIEHEDIVLKVLLMLKSPNGEIRYNPIYYLESDHLPLEETNNLTLWDGKQDIGPIDQIHQKIIHP